MESIALEVRELELDLGWTNRLYAFSCPCFSGSLPTGQGRAEPSRLPEPCAQRKWPKEHRLHGQSAGREVGEW